MIKVEYKDGKVDLEIFGEEPVVLAELTHATQEIYDSIARREGKDTANWILENVFRRARMSKEELEKELAESKEIIEKIEKFCKDRFNLGGIL